MNKYRNKRTNKIAIVSEQSATGMCPKTMGMKMVIYNYESDYPFIMEHNAFYDTHEAID